MSPPSAGPIFILGMLPRSGTNHLWDLLGLHPDVELSTPVYEDQLVRFSSHLVHYVDDVTRHWSREWNVPAEAGDGLLGALGEGILGWLSGESEHRVVTKMPSVEGAGRFFDLFPRSPLVLLVRDGRSVAESGVNTFGWSYERAFSRWSTAADVVIDLMADPAHADRVELVRFEDLVERPAEVVRRVCDMAGLDGDAFPYAEIESLPVRGSSTLTADGGGMHWAPVEKAESFAPVERFTSWSPYLHRRFAEVAGPQQSALGYGLVESGSGAGPEIGERIRHVRDLVFDARYRDVAKRLGRVRRQARRAFDDD